MSGAEPWILQTGQLGYSRKGELDVRLIKTHGGRFGVGGTGERRRGEETKGAGDDRAFVRKTTKIQHRPLSNHKQNSHVTKHILSQENTIQLFGVGDHDHSGRIN